MADVMMDDDDNDKNPIFHDFLGTTFSGGSTCIVGGGDKGKMVLTEPKISVSLASMGDATSGGFDLGRMKSNSDSTFMGMSRDQTQHSKVFIDNVHSERYRRMFNLQNMQQQQQQQQQHQQKHLPGSLIRTRASNPILSKWEHLPLSMNAATPSSLNYHHQNQHPSQGGVVIGVDKIQVGSKAPVANTVIRQTAADEGSRTGIKGAVSILNTIERNTRQKVLESSDMPRVSCTRQMTIFYDGQAHVFDDVHQSKADVIMALAGSNGGSWTTMYGKSQAKAAEASESEASRRNLVFSPNLNSVSLQQPTIRAPPPVTGDILNFITGVQKGSNTLLMEANNDGKRKP